MGREPDGRHNERNSLVTWFDSKTTHFKNKEKAVANYNKVMLIGRLTRDVETLGESLTVESHEPFTHLLNLGHWLLH